jgi:hypothetical protein
MVLRYTWRYGRGGNSSFDRKTRLASIKLIERISTPLDVLLSVNRAESRDTVDREKLIPTIRLISKSFVVLSKQKK